MGERLARTINIDDLDISDNLRKEFTKSGIRTFQDFLLIIFSEIRWKYSEDDCDFNRLLKATGLFNFNVDDNHDFVIDDDSKLLLKPKKNE